MLLIDPALAYTGNIVREIPFSHLTPNDHLKLLANVYFFNFAIKLNIAISIDARILFNNPE